MRFTIAILVMLFAGATAQAQHRDGFTGPLTGYEAELLSEVWPEIRQADRFEDINWRAHGLNRAPASDEAQRFLAANWSTLRREERFANIDWDEYYDQPARSSRAERYGRVENGANERGYNTSPFTREEAAQLSKAWGQIREAARFEDINWRAAGFSGAPGNRDARRIMSQNWGQLREAGRFEDINWQAAGYSAR